MTMSDWSRELSEDEAEMRVHCQMRDECGVQGVRPGKLQCDVGWDYFGPGEHPEWGSAGSGWDRTNKPCLLAGAAAVGGDDDG